MLNEEKKTPKIQHTNPATPSSRGEGADEYGKHAKQKVERFKICQNRRWFLSFHALILRLYSISGDLVYVMEELISLFFFLHLNI